MKSFIRYLIGLLWDNTAVTKYFPSVFNFFCTLDELTDVLKSGIKSIKDGKMTKEEILELGSALELYRVVLDDALVEIMEILREDVNAEESSNNNS